MVTNDGVHTMAYIGHKKWIQADPDKKKVIIDLDITDLISQIIDDRDKRIFKIYIGGISL